MAQADLASTLPAPGRDLFAIPEGSIEVLLSTTLSRRAATRLAMASEPPRTGKGKAGMSKTDAGKAGNTQAQRTARAAHPAPKRAAQAKSTAPRSTRVATSVKKRA